MKNTLASDVKLDALSTSSPSIISGVLIIAGTTVGAGMFSMPVVTAGMWFSWSIVFALATWFLMYHSALFILETNLNYPQGASFDTTTKDTLGNVWNVINGLSIGFVLYILSYAYISAGGSILTAVLNDNSAINIPRWSGALVFAVSLSFIVWVSTQFVGRITTILLAAMAITYVLSLAKFSVSVKVSNLFNSGETDVTYWPFIFSALPFFLTSFGFHGNVPSLVKYYGKDPQKIKYCLLYGSLIALSVYIFWQVIMLGNIERPTFKAVAAEGGNIPALLNAMPSIKDGGSTEMLLTAFSNLAIISSFLGVTLGLFDYIADKFSFAENPTGRFKTALITFAPPTVAGVFFPNGFIYAIGFAGLIATIWTVIVPSLAVRQSRQRFKNASYRVWGGNILVYALLTSAIIIAICHILALFGYLPIYR